MQALKWITGTAKKLQSANKKLAWSAAIKKAGEMYRKMKKPGKVGQGRHTDTKSHNVNIRVVSGAKKKIPRVLVIDGYQLTNPYAIERAIAMQSDIAMAQRLKQPDTVQFLKKTLADHVRKFGAKKIAGAKKIGSVTPEDFKRVNNDVNGNPRYVIHYSNLLTDQEKETIPLSGRYAYAVKKANSLGGRKYTGRDYGGGIVFQSYSLDFLAQRINEKLLGKVGSVLMIERGESPRKKPGRVVQVTRTKSGAFKKFQRVGNLPTFQDEDTAQDILLTADSDGEIYFRLRQPIERNLFKKYKAGKFNLELSEKLWRRYIDAADKMYGKQFRNKRAGYVLSVADRKLLTKQKAMEFYQELQSGNEFN